MFACSHVWGAVPEPPEVVESGWLTRIGLPGNGFVPGNESLIRWAPVPSAETYNVYAYDENTTSWTLVASGITDVQRRFYSPENLSDRYRVTAVNADGESAPSTETLVAPQPAGFMIYIGMLPGLSYVASDITPTNAWLAWSVSAISGADGLVELSTNGTDFSTVYLDTNYSGGHYMWLTNLTPFTRYSYRVTTIGTNRGGYTLTNWFYTDDTNHPPTISDLSVAVSDGNPAYITLSGTEYTLFEWDMIEEFRIISGPTNGTVSAATLPAWNNSAMVTYTPNQNEDYVDHFWYVANDGDLDSAPALVTITHTRNNVPPLAFGWHAVGAEDSVLATPVTAADSPSDVLTFAIVTPPQHGTLSGTPPDLFYTPAPDFFGDDSFVFVANDGELDSNPATITIAITPVNDAPSLTAIADLDGANEDKPAAIEYSVLLAASDAFDADGDILRFRVESILSGQLAKNGAMATPGTTTIEPGDILVWAPYENVNGPAIAAFTVVVTDGGETTTNAVPVRLNVSAINDPPVMTSQSITIVEDQPLSLDFLSATDADGDPVTIRILTGPQHGQVLNWPTSGVYDPSRDYAGTDSITFVANDGTVDSDPATLTITIQNINDPPLPDTAEFTTLEDTPVSVTLTAYDPDNDPLSFALTGTASSGTATLTGSNAVFTPSFGKTGYAYFDYAASDGVYWSTGRVVVNIISVEDVPEAYSQSATTFEDTQLSLTLVGFDGDLDAVTFNIASQPAHGTISIVTSQPVTTEYPAGAQAEILYTPDADYNGTDSFTFTTSDGKGNSSPATVSITINAVNDPPTLATIAGLQFPEDSAAQTINLTGISAGPDGEAQSLSVTVESSNPALTGNPSVSYTTPNSTGTISFTPTANANGQATITVTVSDGQLTTSRSALVDVSPVNDAPTATAQNVTTPYNTPLNITLSGADIEVTPLSFTVVTSPANGTLSGTGANRTFTPNLNWSGTTSFTFRANDGQLNSPAATITITVNPPTSAPTPPSGLAATTFSRSRIDLSWTDTSNTETGFKIERSANGSTWSQIATVGPNVTIYSSTGLSANKLYYYRVRAYNALGNSPYSNTASARTLR